MALTAKKKKDRWRLMGRIPGVIPQPQLKSLLKSRTYRTKKRRKNAVKQTLILQWFYVTNTGKIEWRNGG